jgi:hypothetical protein
MDHDNSRRNGQIRWQMCERSSKVRQSSRCCAVCLSFHMIGEGQMNWSTLVLLHFSLSFSLVEHIPWCIQLESKWTKTNSHSGRCVYWKVNCCLLHKKLHIVSYIGPCEPFSRIVFPFACPVAPFSLMIVILFSCRFPRLSHSHPSRKWQQRAKKKKDEEI